MKSIIAIGGLGGSGTRVIAKMLKSSGIYLGHYLNEPLDNLLFTRIFKNPSLYDTKIHNRINKLLDIFSKKMKGQALSFSESITLARALFSNKCYSSTLTEIYFILTSKHKSSIDQTWAWKEPNTHIYINHILHRFTSLKYVHVIRNGLDMKHSKNKKQAKNWSYIFSIDNNSQSKQWEFWIKSTQRIQEISKLFPNRIYILNYNNLCSHPQEEVKNLFNFLELELTSEQLDKLSLIPKPTPRKYKITDTQVLSKEEIKLMREWGFKDILL